MAEKNHGNRHQATNTLKQPPRIHSGLHAILLLSCWLLVAGAALVPGETQAHTIRPAVVTMVIHDAGEIELEIRTNVEVMLAGIAPEYNNTNDAPNAARYDRLRALPGEALALEFNNYLPEFLGKLLLEADGQAIELSFTSIDIARVADLELARDARIHLQGRVPASAAALVWHWPDEYGSNVLRIRRINSDYTVSDWLRRGQASEPYPLSGRVSERSRAEVALNYVVIGFEHILPKGLDHILFVLGIFLLSIHLRPLLWQVTAFTVAHTITLGLSIYGVISVPATVVEPLIALSIAYVGIENCLSSRLQPWRIVLVFCFGLLHGLGFAGVLTEIGLPRSEMLTALITFNVGVELGQLAIILLAFAVLGWWRNQAWYRARVVIPLSMYIAVIGLYWTWERIVT